MLHMFSISGASFRGMFIILCIIAFIDHGSASNHGTLLGKGRILKAEEELLGESLPLHMGSRLYKLEGLKSFSCYEVKISYPASIPACFSIQLMKGDTEINLNTRLLNTEKLVFKTENLDRGGTHVLVSVEPEDVVAMKHVPERQSVIFNIVCNELLLGIPHQAWWVGLLLLLMLCLVVAFFVPSMLPSYLLPRNPDAATSKDS